MVDVLVTPDSLHYQFYPNTTNAVKFKVQATNDAHVALTKTASASNPMYEIFIGGWGNSKIAIRKNQEQSQVAELPFPNTLRPDAYREFWITWYNNTIAVGMDDNLTPLVAWDDPDMFSVSFVGFRTAWGATGEWLIENDWTGWRVHPHTAHLNLGWNIPESQEYSKPGGSPVWVPSAGGSIPPNAVPGGFDNEQLYIGRAMHSASLTPGKIVPSHGVCYIPWGGMEHAKQEYEVLCGCEPSWVPVQGDNVPLNAIDGGYADDGETLYIGRAQHNDTMTVGKVQKSHKTCYIPYGGQEIGKEAYEVLVI